MCIYSRKQHIYLTILIVGLTFLSGMGIGDLSFVVSGNNEITDSPTIFIESRFKLWDLNEKMIDSQFDIVIVSLNRSFFNYSITINDNIYTGISNGSFKKTFWFNETQLITLMRIDVDNKTIETFTNILIVKGITQNQIQSGISEYTISLNPGEWKKLEWNIFYSIVIGSLLSFFISYRIIKKYRKNKGFRVIT